MESVGKYVGPDVINAQSVTSDLVDLKGGDMQGYQRQKPGIEEVHAELKLAVETHGAAAGIHPAVYESFQQKTKVLAQIRTLKPDVAKLHEVLHESEVFYEDAAERDLIRMAKNVLDAAHHDNNPGLLAVFEKTLKYRSQYGEKAAATRRKKEEAKEQEAKEQKAAAASKSDATQPA